ncbi:hypothetical protein FN846DRAFT_933927 [Sphaerosporella brunnea]|uniref:Metallo-beta-lactamase domain-containing protein n=1 Tax=Sphaerosporella brunnea TaxID=1250544 RepID=A0A5J5F659_9PEZI|nr:hypothetical protein FN846DRAFT_933927 [Sphaerosporella brunnea]
MGPKRYTKKPCDVEELPAVDIVCISHNHYDHTDHHHKSCIKSIPMFTFSCPWEIRRGSHALASKTVPNSTGGMNVRAAGASKAAVKKCILLGAYTFPFLLFWGSASGEVNGDLS